MLVIAAIIVTVFAYYYYFIPLQPNPEALNDATELKVVTGTLVEISGEDLMLRTDEGILTIKKSEKTKYTALGKRASTQINENELQQNEKATIVVSINIENEMTALSVNVQR